MRAFSSITIIFLAAIGYGFLFSTSLPKPQADTSSAAGSIYISPPAPSPAVGSSVTVTLEISGLTGIYAVDIGMGFDPAVLQVVDADGIASGVQVMEGTCPAADFSLANDADNATGLITYTVTQLNPTLPCSSGHILKAQFSCAAPGVSAVTIDSSLISDRNGMVIAHTSSGASISCAGASPPKAIEDLTAALSGVDVDLSWSAIVSDTLGNPTVIDHYQVYSSTNPYFLPISGTLVATAVTPAYTDTGAAGDPAINRYYLAIAEDDIGLTSDISNLVGVFQFALLKGTP